MTPSLRRAAEARRDARIAAIKSHYRLCLDHLSCSTTPPLSGPELATALDVPTALLGRWRSEAPRYRAALPDDLRRALIDVACTGQIFFASSTGEKTRTLQLCTGTEAQRLGGLWDLWPIASMEPSGVNWDADDLWET